MKIVILILSNQDGGIYTKLENSIRSTWGNYKSSDVHIFYYYGSNEFRVSDDKIYSSFAESMSNIGHKTIDAFDYLYNNLEFDYLFRTNSSSYVNIEMMMKFLKEKPRKKFYCARVNVENKTGAKFGSGSGYFLSRDVVKFIVENKKRWNHDLIDDVALGSLLITEGLNLTPSLRLDIDDLIENRIVFNSKYVDESLLDVNFHFRCKSKDINRETDVKIMQYLHNYFNSADKKI